MTRRKPAAETLKIFQIYYRDAQIPHLDPLLTPYDNRGVANPLLEFAVFQTILQQKLAGKARLWGALSWKFSDKTGLSADELFRYLADNPGYDAYYCNPFPEFEGIYHNLWQQGETAHPGFLELAQEIFVAADLPREGLNALYPARYFAAANYIIATPQFWRAYIKFVEKILQRIEKNAAPHTLLRLYSSTADAKGRHAGATYLPFIVERLFGLFLMDPVGAAFNTHKYPLPKKERALNVHQKLLREKKEFCCQHHNSHLAAWWLSHRALYLVAEHGRHWAQHYLPRISPSELIYLPETSHAD